MNNQGFRFRYVSTARTTTEWIEERYEIIGQWHKFELILRTITWMRAPISADIMDDGQLVFILKADSSLEDPDREHCHFWGSHIKCTTIPVLIMPSSRGVSYKIWDFFLLQCAVQTRRITIFSLGLEACSKKSERLLYDAIQHFLHIAAL